MRVKGLTPKVILILLTVDVIVFGLMMSVKKLSAFFVFPGFDGLTTAWLMELLSNLAHSPYSWVALTCMVLSFVLWMTVLSSIDLSVAFPLGSLSYIVIPLLSMLFLHEQIPPMRWFGIAFIIAGILALSMSEKRKGSA